MLASCAFPLCGRSPRLSLLCLPTQLMSPTSSRSSMPCNSRLALKTSQDSSLSDVPIVLPSIKCMNNSEHMAQKNLSSQTGIVPWPEQRQCETVTSSEIGEGEPKAFVPVTPWVLSSFCFWVQGFSPTSGFSLRSYTSRCLA